MGLAPIDMPVSRIQASIPAPGNHPNQPQTQVSHSYGGGRNEIPLQQVDVNVADGAPVEMWLPAGLHCTEVSRQHSPLSYAEVSRPKSTMLPSWEMAQTLSSPKIVETGFRGFWLSNQALREASDHRDGVRRAASLAPTSKSTWTSRGSLESSTLMQEGQGEGPPRNKCVGPLNRGLEAWSAQAELSAAASQPSVAQPTALASCQPSEPLAHLAPCFNPGESRKPRTHMPASKSVEGTGEPRGGCRSSW